jgi:hypothetical protein
MPQNLSCFAPVRPDTPRGRMAYCVLAALLVCAAGAQTLIGNPADVPSVSASMGPCTADFTVSDAANKPIFDAKVHTIVKYGFMSKRDTELEIGTDSGGKARIEGLPEKLKKPPMEFTIKKGDATQSVTNDPALNCHATFTVTLGK